MPVQSEPGLFLLSPHFRVAWADDKLVAHLGLSPSDVLRRDMRALLRGPLQDVFARPDRFACALLGSYADRRYLSGRLCRVPSNDEERQERWLEYSSRPIYSGKHAGGRVECYLDVTGQ